MKVLNYQKYYTGDEGELNSIGYFCSSLQSCALNIVWRQQELGTSIHVLSKSF